MARALRVQFPGAVYHVMCRGNRQESIFKDRSDHELFLRTLSEVRERCGWRIHAYVLMGNHYHILLETPDPNLVDGMRWFQGVYTQRFNARHKLRGHLFQGRYKALLVDDGDYFATVADYIHLNPARARCFDVQTGRLADYPWSSYVALMCPSKRSGWLSTDRVLGSHGLDDSASGRAKYRVIMKKRLLEIAHHDDPSLVDEAWRKIRRGWIFGSESFLERVRSAVDEAAAGCRHDSHSGGAAHRHDEQAAMMYMERGLEAVELCLDELAGLKKADVRKKVIAWFVRKHTSVPNEWVSNALQMGHASTVSRCAREVELASDGILLDLKTKISKIKD